MELGNSNSFTGTREPCDLKFNYGALTHKGLCIYLHSQSESYSDFDTPLKSSMFGPSYTGEGEAQAKPETGLK